MRRAVALGAIVLCVLAGTLAQAQDRYPSRPIKLLVPFPAGGPVDVMGRLVAQHLSTALDHARARGYQDMIKILETARSRKT